MGFIADLHIHSRFSLATSKNLNISTLSEWGVRKGISVLGTGDFVHPKWRQELKETLEIDSDSGLLRPKAGFEHHPDSKQPLFCLQTEISCIYKKYDKTRKVHNLIYAPDFETAEKIANKLADIGSIISDGRPILKIDSRDLLEIVLESSEQAVLAPAHIWTPWYSILGSRSGFDSIEDCFGDLTRHIFMLETGLSSDPAMNRLVSKLDQYTLFSNSDAHSGQNLGREANLFSGTPSYQDMFQALAKKSNLSCKFLGTIEFFPEEGKYHLDGHRACQIVCTPEQAKALGNICPVCGKPLTIGVKHRIYDLADRSDPEFLEDDPAAYLLAPLTMILSQIYGTNHNSQKVQREYLNIINNLGSELDILHNLPLEEIYAWSEPLGEAIKRIRTGLIQINAGFDGQYGTINIFDENELKDIRKGLKC